MARVLVIDDEPDVVEVLSGMLGSGGHSVIHGRPGAEIWTDLADAQYDVVVSDIQMPTIDGWDIAGWVKENRPGIPVIAVSGATGNLRPEQLRAFDAVLCKPVRRALLLETVRDAIGATR